jgi:hypothetical protein
MHPLKKSQCSSMERDGLTFLRYWSTRSCPLLRYCPTIWLPITRNAVKSQREYKSTQADLNEAAARRTHSRIGPLGRPVLRRLLPSGIF